jgi:TRAP-type mannitol/chloroaromatic compound transport system substrate-binding protein
LESGHKRLTARRWVSQALNPSYGLKATNELWAEISTKNPDFKKSIDAMQAYRSDQYLWWQVAEYTFDSFMIRSRTRG